MIPAIARPLETEPRPISQREFELFQRLILAESGIWLAEGKRALLVSRIAKRLRELGLPTYSAYYDHIQADQERVERTKLIDAICTHETQFFREPRQFEFLEDDLIPHWVAEAREGRRERRVRIWSAACSSGEEPFSLGMSLLARLPLEPAWQVEILATDLSTKILARAREATWPMARAQSIPPDYLRRYMLRGRGPHSGKFAAGPALRALVTFAQLNLNTGPFHPPAPFDAIFCRNALIYFEADRRRTAQQHLLQCLVPGGLLFLGHAETIQGSLDGIGRVLPAVYRRGGR